MRNFESLLSDLDLELFAAIVSQSTDDDKQSWLACQLAVREMLPEYRYLEIGSYIGGSLQPYLFDSKCVSIYSIDKRPPSQPDARGFDWKYANNSTERMLDNLRKLDPEGVKKIKTIDGDTRGLDSNVIPDKIDLCLIDGEHTDGAVMSDFLFCVDAIGGTGAIMLDDAQIIYNGLADCIEYLRKKHIKFNAYVLPSKIFVIEIGDFPLHKNPKVHERLVNNHASYLFSLQDNDHYRRFANRAPFKIMRNLVVKVRNSNVNY